MAPFLYRLTCLILLLLNGVPSTVAEDDVLLDRALHHLGIPGNPEWREFTRDRAEGTGYVLRFPGHVNEQEATLFLRQSDVKFEWPVTLNGRSIGRLFLMEADLVHALRLPAGTLHEGENVLEIGPPPEPDDVVVGEVTLDLRRLEECTNRAILDVRVTEEGSGNPVPCRITVVDDRNCLAPIQPEADRGVAARPGVAYAGDGHGRLGVRPGRYVVHATRGFEYSMASRSVAVTEGEETAIRMEIRREVPTEGLVACDTHVHTLTFSGHGDASAEERLITLAGEGIELPIFTDHNHLTDMSRMVRELGLATRMTTVIGDEVTTRRAHFNAFPFRAGSPVPDPAIGDCSALIRGIRSGAEGRIVILNHPRDEHSGFRPFGAAQFNPVSGELLGRTVVNLDAVEIVNSGALQSDPMLVPHDWMALWNRGHFLTAVGGSDSHDVSRYIVGQGRTYIACPDENAGAIDVERACRCLREGRACVSLGLLARITVDGRWGPGDLAPGTRQPYRVDVSVVGPSWTRADRVELYANGVKIHEQPIDAPADVVAKARVSWNLARPAHDVSLVVVASGPGVTAPYWVIPKPYQPSSKDWTPRLLSVTNPVRLDADGDGRFTSAHEYALQAIHQAGTDPSRLFPALSEHDESVAAQAAAICQASGRDVRSPEFTRMLGTAGKSVRSGFAAYRETLSVVEPRLR
jgi:hypothetical protein